MALLAERIIPGKDGAVSLMRRLELNFTRRLLEIDLMFEKSRINAGAEGFSPREQQQSG